MKEDKLIKITREACAMIHEKMPENDYIVSVFQEKDNGRTGQSLQGRMSNKSLIAIANAIINELAEQTGKTRGYVLNALKLSGDPIVRTFDFRRKTAQEDQDD